MTSPSLDTNTNTSGSTQSQARTQTHYRYIELEVSEASREPDGSISVKGWELVSSGDADSEYKSLGVTGDDQELTFTPWKEFRDGRGSLYSTDNPPDQGTMSTFTPEAPHLAFYPIKSGNRVKQVRANWSRLLQRLLLSLHPMMTLLRSRRLLAVNLSQLRDF